MQNSFLQNQLENLNDLPKVNKKTSLIFLVLLLKTTPESHSDFV